jgi:ESX secretion-associated protein EspG
MGVECSLLELGVVADALDLDVRPFPFDFPTCDEPAVEAAARGLIAKGLTDGRSWSPELSRSVELFATAPSIAMLGRAGKRNYCVRASTDGADGVLAHWQGQSVRFETVEPHALIRALVGLLPPMRPGPGDVLELRLPARRQRPDPADPQLAAARELLERPRLGEGYFVVEDGAVIATLNWLDTDAGRYAVVVSDGYAVYQAADLGLLEEELTRLAPWGSP